MPWLFVSFPRGSVAEITAKNIVALQKKTVSEGIWGISESQYRSVDDSGNYRYKAFGIADIAYSENAETGPVAAYASILCMDFDRKAVLKNLSALCGKNMYGRFGFYEAYDGGPLQSFMAHHQGMIMLALTNSLKDVLKKRYDKNPRIKSTLLQTEFLPCRESFPLRKKITAEGGKSIERRVLYFEKMPPELNLMSDGRYFSAVNSAGYRLQVLPVVSRRAIELGLNYVHNDACYPAIVVIGQMLDALFNGRCDPQRTALMLAQTCGPCRASNYPALLRKALQEAGFPQVPILTLSSGSLNKQPGFKMSGSMLHRMILSCLYGDMLQRVSMSCRANELHKGDTDALLERWTQRAREVAGKGDTRAFRKDMRRIVEDFTKIPRDGVVRPKVGIVGEILLKYHPDANNHVARHIMDEGGEPVLTDIMDFFLYCFMDPMYRWKRLGGRILPALGSWLFIMRVEMLRASMRKALEGSIFMPVSRIRHLSHSVKGIISRGNQAGEGWLLTAEMLELIDNGATNVLCLQPFGCLTNHITC